MSRTLWTTPIVTLILMLAGCSSAPTVETQEMGTVTVERPRDDRVPQTGVDPQPRPVAIAQPDADAEPLADQLPQRWWEADPPRIPGRAVLITSAAEAEVRSARSLAVETARDELRRQLGHEPDGFAVDRTRVTRDADRYRVWVLVSASL